MFSKDPRGGGHQRLEIELADGWPEYRYALEFLSQSDWSRALLLLAQAEATFRTLDDAHGLWRALAGQALLHWRDGMAALAIARGLAALRAAETADDGFAVGCVAWQIANMMFGQGECRKAADYLDQAQLALDAVGMAPPGGALAAAAQLCLEIGRWQQMCERQQIGRREAEAAIAEIQRDLVARLSQAALSMRSDPADAGDVGGAEAIFLAPESPALLALPAPVAPRTGLSAWLARLWRRLIYGDDVASVVELTRAPAPATLPRDLGESAADVQADLDPAAGAEAETPATVDLRGAAPAVAQEPPPARPQESPPPPLSAEEPLPAAPAPEAPGAPAQDARPVERAGLAIYCFGNFRVFYNDALVDRWESARGRTIFKYLIARRAAAAPKDLLAELFWPDSEPELARRSLHQAIYCLRQTFKRVASDVQLIQFADDRYQISPEIPIWVDSEEFGKVIEQARGLYAAGKFEQAMQCYAVAIDLYGAPFLVEDRYEEWTEEPRRTYQTMYLEALHRLARHHIERGEHPAAILLCQRALTEESCDEEAHQMLMACYIAQGLRHLAVRQYQICANALKTELGLAPSEELEAFYRRTVAAG
ncbi:MAG TPA: BTAD domain-containing putative transcriptional regulator [Roseiflexaceae bacterium]